MPQNESSTEAGLRITRGKVDSLTLYEITDAELDQLEQGSPATLQLNFAIALISVGISFWISLATTTISDTKTFCVFVIITAVSLLVGIICGVLWYRNRSSVSTLLKKIRQRAAIPEVDENPATDSTES